jgi:hypothetical protein
MHMVIIETHREDILARCLVHAHARSGAFDAALEDGLLLLLSDLAEALCEPVPRGPTVASHSTRLGADLFRMGFSLSQVIHSYGYVREAAAAIAHELGLRIATEDACIFNRCLDTALARAATEHERLTAAALRREADTRFQLFIHELRNGVTVASLAFDALKHAGKDLDSATGGLLERGLQRLRGSIDHANPEVRAVFGTYVRGWVAESGKMVANASPVRG